MRDLKKRAYLGIVSLVLIIPYIILEILKQMERLDDSLLPLYYILMILGVATWVYFIWGYKVIGDKLKIKILSVSTIILIITTILLYAGSLLPKLESVISNLVFSIIILLIVGVISIIFGVALLKLKDKFGALATAAGVLNIISGASFVTIIFFFIALLVLIPLAVFEIILMFKAAEKL